MAFAVASISPHSPMFDQEKGPPKSASVWSRISFSRKIGHWLGKDGHHAFPIPGDPQDKQEDNTPEAPRDPMGKQRRVIPGLPRQATLQRQESERRERLTPIQPLPVERRAVSVDRRRAAIGTWRSRSPAIPPLPASSAPEVYSIQDGFEVPVERQVSAPGHIPEDISNQGRASLPTLSGIDADSDEKNPSEVIPEDILTAELEEKWILNLSMHFRDMSDREKFFITYAETPTRWRRVTVSCDYRDAAPDSLESDLKRLKFQRAKNARIYESIRESLPEIQFYDTVTNLKLQTSEGRLHVHVTEDVHEIIPYPPVSAIRHLQCKRYTENSLKFEAHMSGFVYKVQAQGHFLVKKEIPGPDSVDEFLYELNALQCLSLTGSSSVIQLRGVVVDDHNHVVKGLLIDFAEQGSLVDLMYDFRGSLSWDRRERWARQIVQGLSEIHEAGFVQGDFTLSNIVIDADDNAKIIDINRRGCPVGWEPPELSILIESGQRIAMFIGVKSDLYQLGMVLWGIAEEQDEPERQEKPLTFEGSAQSVPQYYREIVAICLSNYPQFRLAAQALLARFPAVNHSAALPLARPVVPELPISHGWIPVQIHLGDTPSRTPHFDHTQQTTPLESDISLPSGYEIPAHAANPDGLFDDEEQRGRSPSSNTAHLRYGSTSTTDVDPQIISVSPDDDRRWEHLEVDGAHYLIDREKLGCKTSLPDSRKEIEVRDSIRSIEDEDSAGSDDPNATPTKLQDTEIQPPIRVDVKLDEPAEFIDEGGGATPGTSPIAPTSDKYPTVPEAVESDTAQQPSPRELQDVESNRLLGTEPVVVENEVAKDYPQREPLPCHNEPLQMTEQPPAQLQETSERAAENDGLTTRISPKQSQGQSSSDTLVPGTVHLRSDNPESADSAVASSLSPQQKPEDFMAVEHALNDDNRNNPSEAVRSSTGISTSVDDIELDQHSAHVEPDGVGALPLCSLPLHPEVPSNFIDMTRDLAGVGGHTLVPIEGTRRDDEQCEYETR